MPQNIPAAPTGICWRPECQTTSLGQSRRNQNGTILNNDLQEAQYNILSPEASTRLSRPSAHATIDIYISNMGNISQPVVYLALSSDHYPVVAEVGSSVNKFHRVDWSQFQHCIDISIDYDVHPETTDDIDRCLRSIDEVISRAREQHIPVSKQDYEEQEGVEKEQLEFENRYYDAKSFLMEKAKKFQEESALNQLTRSGDAASPHGTMDRVGLPQIKLQTFDRDIDDWLNFRDLYTSLIHEKPDLPEVEKFHYLKGCLAGEAKALVDPLKITSNNYPIAWESLLKRYNNSKLLRRKQVQALVKLPSLTKESVTDLHRLADGFDRAIQIMDQVIEPAEYKDSRLNPVTRRGWEEHTSAKEQDTLQDLQEFLQRRIQILESLPKAELKNEPQQPKWKSFSPKVSHHAVQWNTAKCPSCTEVHGLHTCPAFLEMSVPAGSRSFEHSHSAETVSRRSSRNGSPKKANSGKSGNLNDSSSDPKAANAASVQIVSSNTAQSHTAQVLLATAVVVIEDNQGSRYPARALLDFGSQCNFISEDLSQLMKVSSEKVDVSISGVGQTGTRVNRKIQAVVKSRFLSYSRTMEFLVLPKVTACLPTSTVQANGWDIPADIELADLEFFRSRKVDLVMGIQAFFSFFPSESEIPLGTGLPVLTETVIVNGTVWSCKEVGAVSKYTPDETRCEELFERTVERDGQ
ncbi:uncharacterized protein LOC135708901 [Ochlerotatus camptorhynchus]|uniref:uncharacterized protein LOC135708901 n=1 Tax=Ochlerotatus camptorhynchus TaxID=644619 RepID=UPI0031DAA344